MYPTTLRVIFFALLAHTTFTTVALSQDGEACSAMAQFAETTMKARQRDVPLSTLLVPLEELGKTDPASSEIAQKILLIAYTQPIGASDEEKNEAVSTFRLAVELKCRGVSVVE